jgi:hypothetical protein
MTAYDPKGHLRRTPYAQERNGSATCKRYNPTAISTRKAGHPTVADSSIRVLQESSEQKPEDGMHADLDVYVEDRRRFLAGDYILNAVLKRAVRQGAAVRLFDRLNPPWDASAAFVHVDLTTVPAPFIWVNSLYSRCINGRSISIARDLYSMARLFPGDDFSGPVIVKTVLNHRGLPELIHAATERRVGPGFDAALRDRVCPKYQIFPGTLDLPIIKHRHDFMLDIELNTRAEFNNLLCVPNSLNHVDFIEGAPQEVYDVRRRLKLDFGSIDFFVVDGQATVIDVNRTTTFTRHWVEAYLQLRNYFDALAERLRSFATSG